MTELFKNLVNDQTFGEIQKEQEEKPEPVRDPDPDMYPVIRRGKVVAYQRI